MKHNITILAALCILGIISQSFAADSTPEKRPAGITSKQFAAFKLQAKQGDVEAQFNLGVCYEKGQGVAKDLK